MGIFGSGRNTRPALAILGLLVLALGIRLVNLGQSLWLDEAVSVLTARNLSLVELWRHYRSAHFQPPLHSFVLWFWGRTFGWSEVSMRFPSVLAGVGVVWGGIQLGKIWINKRFGLSLGLLLAMAPFLVYYSQEARPYSLALCLSLGWMVSFSRLLKNEGGWLGYVFWGSLSLWSGYYNALLIPVQWLVCFKHGKRRGLLKKLFVNQLLVGLSFLPWLPTLLVQLRAGAEATRALPAWGTMINLAVIKIIPVTLIKFWLGRITFFDKGIYAFVAVVLGVFSAWLISRGAREKKNRLFFWLGIGWLLIPLGFVWAASLRVPNYQPFRVLVVMPAFYFLLALGARRSKILFGFLIGISFLGLVAFWTQPYFWREDWRSLARWLGDERLLIIPSTSSVWPLTYYGVGNWAIGAAEGIGSITKPEGFIFESRLTGRDEFVYLPYLESLFDPQGKIRTRFEQLGFAKIDETEFNQLPVEVWQKNEDRE